MTKTFREVIRDIKKGEVWESCNCKIERFEKGIQLEFRDGEEYNTYYFTDEVTYTLVRPQYTFTEAFAEYEKGAEIESCYSENKYSIQHGGCDCVNDKKTNNISFWEIRNKWYINKEVE